MEKSNKTWHVKLLTIRIMAHYTCKSKAYSYITKVEILRCCRCREFWRMWNRGCENSTWKFHGILYYCRIGFLLWSCSWDWIFYNLCMSSSFSSGLLLFSNTFVMSSSTLFLASSSNCRNNTLPLLFLWFMSFSPCL